MKTITRDDIPKRGPTNLEKLIRAVKRSKDHDPPYQIEWRGTVVVFRGSDDVQRVIDRWLDNHDS